MQATQHHLGLPAPRTSQTSRTRIYSIKCHGRAKIVRVATDKAARREALALALAVGAFDDVYSRVLCWAGHHAETFGPVSITPMDVAA